VRIKLNGFEAKDHPVMDRNVLVRVNPWYSMSKFLQEHWKWLVAAIRLPLIAWFAKWLIVWLIFGSSLGGS
jgi:hypothetical protein